MNMTEKNYTVLVCLLLNMNGSAIVPLARAQATSCEAVTHSLK